MQTKKEQALEDQEKKAKGTLNNVTTQFALERQDRKDARAERAHSNNENRRKNEL